MKLIKLSIFGLIVFLGSCIKRNEYKCVCSGGWGGTEYRELTIKSVNEQRAAARCSANGNTPDTDDGVHCKLEK